MKRKFSYRTEAAILVRVIDIAVDSMRAFNPKNLDPSQTERFISAYLEWRALLSDPNPEYPNRQSIADFHESIFTYFQESSGRDVDLFWAYIKSEALPFERQNKFAKILERGSIRGRREYDFVQDVVIAAEQADMISSQEAARLMEMVNAYELSVKKKLRTPD